METPIHKFAAKGFDVSSDAYERGRPDYPEDAIDFMIRELGLAESEVVADVGAGTGKFTRLLRKSGARIIAIEPVEGMRRKFSSVLPNLEVLNGTAENIPLSDASLDAVVVAQAFHWFNGEVALKEIHRVLKPNGKIGLIWNIRDEQIPWLSKLTEIIAPFERGAPRYYTGDWRKAFDSTKLFSPLRYSCFRYVQTGDVETVVDRVGSISFIASLEGAEREMVLKQVRDLVQQQVQKGNFGTVEMSYRTDVFICEKA